MAFLNHFTLGWLQLAPARPLVPSMHCTLVWGPFYQIWWPQGILRNLTSDPSWPLHDLWPQQWVTLWSGALPTKFGGHTSFLSNLTLADPCMTLNPSNASGILSTKFGGHRAFLSNLTPGWPQMTPAWSLTPTIHYTLVRGSSHQIWWP